MSMFKQKKSKAEMAGDATKQLQLLGRLGVPYAAAYLGIHPYTLRSYIKMGEVECIMVGSRPHILRNELERFKREGKRTNATPSQET